MYHILILICSATMLAGPEDNWDHCPAAQRQEIWSDSQFASYTQCSEAANTQVAQLMARPGWRHLVIGALCGCEEWVTCHNAFKL